MFCVWLRRPGQHGTLLQTDRSLHNQSGAGLGEVSGSKASKLYVSVINYIFSNIKWLLFLQLTHSLIV